MLKQGDGHAADEALFELGLRLEMAHLALEGAQISRPIVSGQEKKEGRQIFFVEFDVFAGGDGIHGAAVFAFGGDGPFGFGSVLAGDCGAALALFFGKFFAWHGGFSWLEMRKALLFPALGKRNAFA
jgi:hypothetical protein